MPLYVSFYLQHVILGGFPEIEVSYTMLIYTQKNYEGRLSVLSNDMKRK